MNASLLFPKACDKIYPDNIFLMGSDEVLPMIYMALVDEDDVPSFEKMYERTYKNLYTIAFGMLNDHQLAEDALSEMYLRISMNFKKINNFSLHKIDAYLVRSIRNTCYNFIEKNSSERKKLEEFFDFTRNIIRRIIYNSSAKPFPIDMYFEKHVCINAWIYKKITFFE